MAIRWQTDGACNREYLGRGALMKEAIESTDGVIAPDEGGNHIWGGEH
jgi:hypothetical protein